MRVTLRYKPPGPPVRQVRSLVADQKQSFSEFLAAHHWEIKVDDRSPESKNTPEYHFVAFVEIPTACKTSMVLLDGGARGTCLTTVSCGFGVTLLDSIIDLAKRTSGIVLCDRNGNNHLHVPTLTFDPSEPLEVVKA